MWGRTSQGTATSCGIGVRLQVIEGEMLLLFHACTSITVSLGDPSSCGIKPPREQPPAVVSEFDCRSSKVRCSSSSMIDPHSHDHHHLRGLASCSILPCSSSTLLDSSLGPTSPCYSSSSCSSSYCSLSSSSCEEESSGQLTRQWALGLAMRDPSWETRGA